MSEELKENETKECKCICQNENFKKFVTIALGTFVGAYCALSLFAALHKPPMMPPCAFGPQGGMRGCPVKVMPKHHFDKGPHHFRGPVQNFDKNEPGLAPFETNRGK